MDVAKLDEPRKYLCVSFLISYFILSLTFCLVGFACQYPNIVDYGLINIEEHATIFEHILAHHKKNHSIQVKFRMYDRTVSEYVHRVLCALLHCQDVLLAKPEPIFENCTNER